MIVNHNFFEGLPRDPFEGDPDDPANLLEPDEPFAPLTDQERREVIEDLAAVREFREVLTPEGLLGISMLCEDCGEEHFYNWDVLETHYLMLLAGQESPVHEPQFDPDVRRYAPWEYCAGFVDGRRSRRF
ncbi:DUF5319 domain-containing protein [Corynebacterium lactis]|uniref:DUF5319 domain-containing protein n=1 Tax=Corynebacterium lactis RW2-5 TaxID=1408189 RepID=A0A0K2GY97_9CORY|nr:DUF5319 domain-containing protein [Corynebacterium lactis]ALA66757.1 hypothetical protein CLAC_02340 [Corynebacterium lactis RW2-5]